MAMPDLFSRRKKAERGMLYLNIYKYDELPKKLRSQVVLAIRDATGSSPAIKDHYDELRSIFCREHGIIGNLTNTLEKNPQLDVLNYILNVENIERALDLVELCTLLIDIIVRKDYQNYYYGRTVQPDDAINEINIRFRENGVGYQYVSGKIIRVDSQYTHSEIILPVVKLLHEMNFEGANEEFLKAHEYYRKTDYKECLNNCLKAFESTMKNICELHIWTYNKTDTASSLLKVLFDKKLIPDFMQTQFSNLKPLLESGIPTVRNKMSGHGQGTTIVPVPAHIARYALNVTASNILLLVEAHNTIK